MKSILEKDLIGIIFIFLPSILRIIMEEDSLFTISIIMIEVVLLVLMMIKNIEENDNQNRLRLTSLYCFIFSINCFLYWMSIIHVYMVKIWFILNIVSVIAYVIQIITTILFVIKYYDKEQSISKTTSFNIVVFGPVGTVIVALLILRLLQGTFCDNISITFMGILFLMCSLMLSCCTIHFIKYVFDLASGCRKS